MEKVQELPLCGPKTRAQLPALIRQHEDALSYSQPAEIGRMLGALSVAFPTTRESDAEAKARLDVYKAALCDIPADILRTALQEAVKQHSFFPTVAEIRKLAAPAFSKRKWQLMALQHMQARHDREWKPEPVETVDASAIADLAADLARKLSTSDGPNTGRKSA